MNHRVIMAVGLIFIFSASGCINPFNPGEEESYIEFSLLLKPSSNDNYTVFIPIPVISLRYAEVEDEGEPITLMNNLQFIRGLGNYSIELKNQSYYLKIKSNDSIEIGGYMEGFYNYSNTFEKLSSSEIYLETSTINTLIMDYHVLHFVNIRRGVGFETTETQLKNGWQTVVFDGIGWVG